MKVLQINTVFPTGSTGMIALGIQNQCRESGIDCQVAYRFQELGESTKNSFTVSSWLDCHIHNRLSIITGLQGCFSFLKTFTFLKKVKQYGPDIIHLHNIHGSYIHYGLLFHYIKKNKIPVVWTLHDCWAFTGYCAHFAYEECSKWKTGCYQCPKYKKNAHALLDNSRLMWKFKRKWFTDLSNLTIVTPSDWLSDQVKQSFLKEYPIKVINNGIDLTVFCPKQSEFRIMNNFERKYLLLGVSFGWNEKKGLDVFIELAKRLPDDYQIVLVGTNEKTDKLLPHNIISIHRTQNQQELAEIYSVVDVFVNPTREEVLGLVNIEALACGTPGITFRSGGSPECYDKTCGSVVDCDDIDTLEKEIIRICTEKPYTKEACIKKSKEFDKNDRFKEYIDLYERINAAGTERY